CVLLEDDMSRSLIAGATDYSRQSFDDMISDLKDWLKGLSETIEIFNAGIATIRESTTWDSVSDDMKILILQSLQFYETTYKEIYEILEEMQIEVQSHHTSRLKSLSKTAGKLNDDYGEIWNASYTQKDRRHPEYKTIQTFYIEGRS